MFFLIGDRVWLHVNKYARKGITVGDIGTVIRKDDYGWWTNYIVKFDNGAVEGFPCEEYELLKFES